MRSGMLRAVGAATAVYGFAVAARPAVLARPAGLVTPDGGVAEDTRLALLPLGWRDAASGLAMVVAPDGAALRTAALLRIAADLGDAVLLGRRLRTTSRRYVTIAVSVGWATLSVAALVAPERPPAD
ncbi:hypothetical protein [Actinacidiphila yeochonensis]|uniref:hypothetical protein n=1 Tax=Actinacidiphila yeochonensis TaxID=89050 RepID=UPI00056BFF78|nr:hypothetical protein [Actinacidiphila yeochonensis]